MEASSWNDGAVEVMFLPAASQIDRYRESDNQKRGIVVSHRGKTSVRTIPSVPESETPFSNRFAGQAC